jgi:hypothetical protein
VGTQLILRNLWRALCLTCLAWMGAAYGADELVIRAPSVTNSNGVYVLNARLQFETPDDVEQQIRDGATLALDLQVRFTRRRNWWRDAALAELEQRYELQYHSVSERYVLRNLNSGAQTSFVTLTEALVSLQQIENVPLIDQNLIVPDERNEISLHARVELRSIPGVLRTLLFWRSEYSEESIWYTWPMTLPITWPQNSNPKP